MLAFPVAKLESVGISHRGATTLLVSPQAAPGRLPVRPAQRHLASPFTRAVLNLQPAEFNLRIHESEHSATYRKHTATIRSNRQKFQKSFGFSARLCPSEPGGPVHSPRGQS